MELVKGLAVLKKAAAIANKEFGLDKKLSDTICISAEEVLNSFSDLKLTTC